MEDGTTVEGREPLAGRPYMPEGYGVPEDEEGLLPWSHVVERLERAINYWVATAGPDGRPHSTPIWGGYVDGRLYFEGSPRTRRGRNLARNPNLVVHLESGDDVVIVEGTTEEILPDGVLAAKLAEVLGAKYEERGNRPRADQWDKGGLYLVQPRVVFGWTQFPQNVTRWRFE